VLPSLRIGRAAALLANPRLSIADIAYAAGFSSQSHLTSVFRRLMGTTPYAYRQGLR